MYIGLIYNWKGFKEENYLYTLDEMAELDFGLLAKCINHPTCFQESDKVECPWKTFEGRLLRSDEEVIQFLTGTWNDTSRMDEDSEEYTEDWYWANQLNNDLYGVRSDTMRKAIGTYRVSESLCQ